VNAVAPDLAAVLLGLELELLDPAVRRDRERVQALLAEDFEEFGSSGGVWTRDEIVSSLATEAYEPPALADFRCRLLAPGAALVQYKTERIDAETGRRKTVNRCSIWIEEIGRWRMLFHQGTPAA